MRNAKNFQIRKNLNVTVPELNVGQALEIFWLIGDFVYPTEFEIFLQAHRTDALEKARALVSFKPEFNIEKLSPDEQQLLIGHFIAVNKAFFNSNSEAQDEDYGFESINLTGFEHYQNLSALVNALVRLKHADVLSYPMSFLNEIVAEIKKMNDENGG